MEAVAVVEHSEAETLNPFLLGGEPPQRRASGASVAHPGMFLSFDSVDSQSGGLTSIIDYD